MKNLLWKTSLNPLFFPFSSFLSFISFSIFSLSFCPSFLLFSSIFSLFHSLALYLEINLPPAGKLHTFGYSWHTLSSVLQIITLPSQTTSTCMDASRTSTSIRSKHYLERGTYSWVMNESFNMNCFCCASMEVAGVEISVESAKFRQQSSKSLSNTENRKLFAIRVNNFTHCRIHNWQSF